MIYKSIYPRPEAPLLHKRNNSLPLETPPIRFPEQFQIIIRSDRPAYGNLYLGNLEAALNPTLLATLQITSLLSVAEGYQPSHPKEVIRHHKYLPIQDSPRTDLHKSLLEGVDFLSQQMLVSNVLVHCVAGLSRSACFVIAYLMKEKKISLDEAIGEVRSRRRMVQISEPMREELRKYELDLHNQAGRRNKYNYSVRVNSNHNASSIAPSYFKQVTVDDGSILAELYTQKDRIMEIDQSSQISQRSYASKQASNASKKSYIAVKTENPEKEILENSFKQKFSPQLQVPTFKRKSSSRIELQKKINLIDSRNSQINQALTAAQTKYDNELKASKITFRNSASKAERVEQRSMRLSPSRLFKGLLY